MSWEYKREEKTFDQLPVGDYRIRIESAEKAVSKAGNDMLTFRFAVSGSNSKLYHYLTFMKDKVELTNQKLTEFFDSFKDIKEGDFNTANWTGKVGACHVKHDDEGRAKISYFIKADKQDSLPAWIEPDGRKADNDGFVNVPEGIAEDLPF